MMKSYVFRILRVSRMETRLTVHRPLDILKLWGGPMGCLGQRLLVPWTRKNIPLKNRMIQHCPNVLLKFQYVHVWLFCQSMRKSDLGDVTSQRQEHADEQRRRPASPRPVQRVFDRGACPRSRSHGARRGRAVTCVLSACRRSPDSGKRAALPSAARYLLGRSPTGCLGRSTIRSYFTRWQ